MVTKQLGGTSLNTIDSVFHLTSPLHSLVESHCRPGAPKFGSAAHDQCCCQHVGVACMTLKTIVSQG